MIDIGVALQAADELGPLSPSAARLARLMHASEWAIEDVVATVSYDPALSAKLLRLANSAAFGARQRIASVDAAVLRLGPAAVVALAFGASIGPSLSQALPGYGMAEGELWRHSVAAALAAERLRTRCRVPIPPESHTAALLHDIGKLALSRCLDARTQDLLRFAREERGMSALEAEKEVLLAHHGQVGGAIAERWQLPGSLVRAITYHHTPDDAPVRGMEAVCFATRLADAVAEAILEPPESRSLPMLDRLGAAQSLGLEPGGFARLCVEVEELLEDVLAAYA